MQMISAGATLAVAVAVFTSANLQPLAAPATANAPKVSICHSPPGNPGNAQSMSVSPAAAANHIQQHGDRYDLSGTWSGLFNQPGFAPYVIDLNIQLGCAAVGAQIGLVNYPEFDPCGGTWSLLAANGGQFTVLEQLNPGNCISDCQYNLTFNPNTGALSLVGVAGSCPFGPETWTALLSRE